MHSPNVQPVQLDSTLTENHILGLKIMDFLEIPQDIPASYEGLVGVFEHMTIIYFQLNSKWCFVLLTESSLNTVFDV